MFHCRWQSPPFSCESRLCPKIKLPDNLLQLLNQISSSSNRGAHRSRVLQHVPGALTGALEAVPPAESADWVGCRLTRRIVATSSCHMPNLRQGFRPVRLWRRVCGSHRSRCPCSLAGSGLEPRMQALCERWWSPTMRKFIAGSDLEKASIGGPFVGTAHRVITSR